MDNENIAHLEDIEDQAHRMIDRFSDIRSFRTFIASMVTFYFKFNYRESRKFMYKLFSASYDEEKFTALVDTLKILVDRQEKGENVDNLINKVYEKLDKLVINYDENPLDDIENTEELFNFLDEKEKENKDDF